MTIRLVFDEDTVALLRNMPDDYVNQPPVALEEDLFEQVVTLNINGERLIRRQLVPVLYLAVSGLDVLEALAAGPQKLEIPGDGFLVFRLSGQLVTIDSPSYGHASVDYTEILDVWRLFYKRAKQFVLECFPRAGEHPLVAQWFLTHDSTPTEPKAL